MRSVYYQFINFIQELPNMWYTTLLVVLFCIALISVIRFFKVYNGTQKNFEKLSLLFLSFVLLAVLIFLVYIRK